MAASGRPLHPNDLRVFFAMSLYQAENREPLEIQLLLGHSSSQTTEG